MDYSSDSIATLVGVALGWLLTASSSWFKNSKDDKRVKKQILANLLELHYLLNKLDIHKPIELATETAFKKLPVADQTDIHKQYLRIIYSKTLTGIFLQDVEKKLIGLEINYNSSIEALTKYDPIMAFKLNGTTKIMEVFTLMRSSFEQIHLQFESEISIQDYEMIEKIVSTIQPKIIKGAIEGIETKILKLAKSISRKMGQEIKKTLVETSEISADEITEFIDEVMPALTDTKM